MLSRLREDCGCDQIEELSAIGKFYALLRIQFFESAREGDMPKAAKTLTAKISSILNEFPDEFIHGPRDQLYCQLGECNVSFSKRHVVTCAQTIEMP